MKLTLRGSRGCGIIYRLYIKSSNIPVCLHVGIQIATQLYFNNETFIYLKRTHGFESI